MELVVAVQKRKLASIDVIGMEEFPFETVLGKDVGRALLKVRYPFVWLRSGARADYVPQSWQYVA